MPDPAVFLDHRGVRLRVDRAGLLLGRSPVCDVILTDPRASRSQALVRVGSSGPEVVHLGRHATLLNGSPVSDHAPLASGDVLEVVGQRFEVAAHEGRGVRRAWAIQVRDGLLVGATRRELSFGSGADDVVLPDLPARALVVHRVGDSLLLEVNVDARLDGEPVPSGSLEPLDVDQVISVDEHVLVVQSDLPASPTVGTSAGSALATAVELAFLPVGARLTLAFAGARTVVELSEMRCRLVALLLNPPGDYTAGDHVPDELVLEGVWPRDPSKSRTDLNQLVHRVRKTLVGAGVDPQGVLSRPRTGGSVAFRLHPGAHVTVR